MRGAGMDCRSRSVGSSRRKFVPDVDHPTVISTDPPLSYQGPSGLMTIARANIRPRARTFGVFRRAGHLPPTLSPGTCACTTGPEASCIPSPLLFRGTLYIDPLHLVRISKHYDELKGSFAHPPFFLENQDLLEKIPRGYWPP
uniref:Uncharacterized protein n=1 Tax=Triticum urartu TaxID=4572 RepID=A0A8R7UH28_TRIUA